MLLFRKIWFALFSCNARFEIRRFALLPTYSLLESFFDSYCLTVKKTTVRAQALTCVFLSQKLAKNQKKHEF